MKHLIPRITVRIKKCATFEFYLNGELIAPDKVFDIFEEMTRKDSTLWAFRRNGSRITVYNPPSTFELSADSTSASIAETEPAKILDWLPSFARISVLSRTELPVRVESEEKVEEIPLQTFLNA